MAVLLIIQFYYMFRLSISAIISQEYWFTGLSPLCSFCEPVFLPSNGWNRQPKHVVELNNSTLYKSCIVVLFDKTQRDGVT